MPGPDRSSLFRLHRTVTVTARERTILTAIRKAGALTRSELIREVDLSGPAVFRTTEELAVRGLVAVGASVANGPGKPSHLVSLRPEALGTIGLAIMTDSAEAVLLDFTGVVRARRDLSVEGMPVEPVLQGLNAFITVDAAEAGFGRDALFGVGVAIAGFFVGEGARVNPAAPLDAWALQDLDRLVGHAIGLPVYVENIANAAAVGEALLGVGRHVRSFAYINVAHGFGAGLVLDGRLYRGRHGNAGEVAGILDQFAGLPAPNLETLRRRIGQAGIQTNNVRDLLSRYDDTWPGLAAWVEWAAPSFTFLAAMFHRTLDCDAVVLGGRLPPQLADRLVERLSFPADASARRGVGLPGGAIVAAEVFGGAAPIGAAAIPLQAGFFSGGEEVY